MRIHILIASAAALAACGGSTAPVTSSVPDASSDVSFDHNIGQGGQNADAEVAPPAHSGAGAVRHPSQQLPERTGAAGSSSGGIVDAGASADASTGSASFACGSVMCMAPGQYCHVSMTPFGNNTSYECMMTPFACSSSGPTCGCVQPANPFDAAGGCACSANGSHVTLTCPY